MNTRIKWLLPLFLVSNGCFLSHVDIEDSGLYSLRLAARIVERRKTSDVCPEDVENAAKEVAESLRRLIVAGRKIHQGDILMILGRPDMKGENCAGYTYTYDGQGRILLFVVDGGVLSGVHLGCHVQ